MNLAAVWQMAEESYFRALASESRDDWNSCVTHCQLYVKTGGGRNVHPFLNLALNRVGRVSEAYESCKAGLLIEPENGFLVANLKLYEKHLGLGEHSG